MKELGHCYLVHVGRYIEQKMLRNSLRLLFIYACIVHASCGRPYRRYEYFLATYSTVRITARHKENTYPSSRRSLAVCLPGLKFRYVWDRRDVPSFYTTVWFFWTNPFSLKQPFLFSRRSLCKPSTIATNYSKNLHEVNRAVFQKKFIRDFNLDRGAHSYRKL